MSLLLITAFLLNATAYDDTFNGACAAYSAGDYDKAIQQYEQLVSESVVNPTVFFNLGNAYFRKGALGPAIANYERVLQLSPAFDGARENLAKAVGDTRNHLARPAPPDWQESLLFWHYQLSRRATNTFAALFWLTLWGALALRQWRPLRYTRRIAIAAGVLAVAFGFSAWEKAHPELLAVANADVVHVHYGTNESETVRFDLNEGDRVTVDKRVPGWSRVTTQNGERGWAQDADLVFVGPPYEPPAKIYASSEKRTAAPVASDKPGTAK